MSVSTFTHDGASLVVEEHGAGEQLYLLIHGIGMGRGVFVDLIEHLARHGRVVAIDLPGYGEAPEPPRTPTMERLADLVAAMLRSRGLSPAIVVGHSMGTQVAVELAARHPSTVRRVVLAGPTVNPAERTATRQILRLAQDLAIESPLVLYRGAREYVRARPHLRRKMRAMLAHRPEHTYPHVHQPVLVLRGEHDRVVPAEWAREVGRMLPDSRYAEVQNHGHETMIHAAGAAAVLILAFR